MLFIIRQLIQAPHKGNDTSLAMTVQSSSQFTPPRGSLAGHIAPVQERVEYTWVSRRPCPCCGAHLERLQRRTLDGFISLAVPVHRYRCRACQWAGRLRLPASLGNRPLARLFVLFRYHWEL
jgi:hypothetical protein